MLIDRYLARTIVSGIAMVALVFAGLFLFIDFIRELRNVGTADYGVASALYYVLLNLPQRLYQLAPSIILVGSVVSLGALAAGSELVVMRASGLSIMRITRSVVQAGLIIIVFVTLLGEFVAPYTVSMAQSFRVQAMSQTVLASGSQGLWSRNGQRYINIGRVLPDKQLRDIDIYELDQHRKMVSSTRISSAHPEHAGWSLSDVSISYFSDSGVRSEHFEQQHVDELVQLELFDVLDTEPEEMSARDLYHYADYLQQNNLDADIYNLQFWMKLFTPLTCLVMLLLALPLVFGSQARSGGVGQRVVIGLSIGILFYVLNRLVNHLGLVYGLPPAFSAAIPPMLAAFAVMLLLRRTG